MNSGTYNYYLNGEPTGVIETFEIKILPDGSKRTTSTRDAKPFNTMITVETIEKDGKFQNCQISYQKDELEAEAAYQFSEKNFHIWRKINGETLQDETFDFRENSIFFPLMRCFQGQTILQVAENQDFTTVIVPDIQPLADFENLLKLIFDERKAKILEKNAVIVYSSKGVTIKVNLYQYLSEHYDDHSQFWIDENALLIAYQFHQAKDKIWTVQLRL